MVDVSAFEVVDMCNEILDAMADKDYDTVIDKVSVLRDHAQTNIDKYDEWVTEQAKIQEEIDAGKHELDMAYLENYGTNQ